MKNTLVMLILAFGIHSTFAEKPKIMPNKVTIGSKSTIKQSDYPYLAVSVLFRNGYQMADKTYLSKFEKMEFFYAEVVLGDDRSQLVPLFIYENRNGKFATTSNEDMYVVRKCPLMNNGDDVPNVTINIESEIKNKGIEVVKFITDKVTPVLSNPKSYFGPTAPQAIFGFLGDVVKDINANRQLKSSITFPAVSDENIVPYENKVVFLCPASTVPTTTNWTVKKGLDGVTKLYMNDGNPFLGCPYFIIQTGLSNYLNKPGLPSHFRSEQGDCEITEDQFKKMESDFNTIDYKISSDQRSAENNLLALYSLLNDIQKGVNSQGLNPDIKSLTTAYNVAFTFRKRFKEIVINENLRKTVFEKIYKDLINCIEEKASRLQLYKFQIKPVIEIFEKDISNINNTDLMVLNSYLINTKKLEFIKNTSFHSVIVSDISLFEEFIYNMHFESIVNILKNAERVSETTKQAISRLVELKQQFDKCKFCMEESLLAEKSYASQVRDQELRNSMSELISVSYRIDEKGVAYIEHLDFIEKALKDTSIVNKLDIQVPINKLDLSIKLKELKNNTSVLNEKLKLPNITTQESQSISQTIKTMQKTIAELLENYLLLEKFFENSKALNTTK